MSELQFTQQQQLLSLTIAKANANPSIHGPGDPFITHLIPAQDGLNVYIRFSDGRLWYSNDCNQGDNFIIPVNEGPAVNV